MEFSFKYRLKPEDLLLLTMANIYKSMVGVVSIIFTSSMILLTIRFWAQSILPIKLLLIFTVLIFPLFQPILIYIRSYRVVRSIPNDLILNIDKKRILVNSGNKSNQLSKKDLISVKKLNKLVILNFGIKGIYILNIMHLEIERDHFYNYIKKYYLK